MLDATHRRAADRTAPKSQWPVRYPLAVRASLRGALPPRKIWRQVTLRYPIRPK